MKLKKNDKIKVLAGKDRGKTGKVMNVNSDKGTVLVEGLNIYKKHKRPRKQGEKGEIVQVPRPFNMSNVALLCPNCDKATRVGMKVEGEKKMRFCKKCNSTL